MDRVTRLSDSGYVMFIGIVSLLVIGLVYVSVNVLGDGSGLSSVMWEDDLSLGRQMVMLIPTVMTFAFGLYIALWFLNKRLYVFEYVALLGGLLVMYSSSRWAQFYDGLLAGDVDVMLSYWVGFYVVVFLYVVYALVRTTRVSYEKIVNHGCGEDYTISGIWRLVGVSVVFYVVLANVIQVLFLLFDVEIGDRLSLFVYANSVFLGVWLVEEYTRSRLTRVGKVDGVGESLKEGTEG